MAGMRTTSPEGFQDLGGFNRRSLEQLQMLVEGSVDREAGEPKFAKASGTLRPCPQGVSSLQHHHLSSSHSFPCVANFMRSVNPTSSNRGGSHCAPWGTLHF